MFYSGEFSAFTMRLDGGNAPPIYTHTFHPLGLSGMLQVTLSEFSREFNEKADNVKMEIGNLFLEYVVKFYYGRCGGSYDIDDYAH